MTSNPVLLRRHLFGTASRQSGKWLDLARAGRDTGIAFAVNQSMRIVTVDTTHGLDPCWIALVVIYENDLFGIYI